ncbi:glycerophosphodiester phosphodiesterase family protein [candidate division KSB1 bacterium]|nr:glycerophosphodiester phosphodiesterase family protein [candidate division KSB1 bacterium]
MKNLMLLSIPFIFLFACDSKMKKPLLTKPPKHGGIYVVAHRGAHNTIPENSIPAYQKAIDLGCDFVEIDVRTTKDGKFVCIHNSTIDKYVEGVNGKIEDFTLAELRVLDIGSRVGPQWKGTQIPTFEEILDLCKGKCGIYLDLKEVPVKPLIDKIKARGMERDVLWYADDHELEQVKELCPQCIIMPDPGAEENLSGLIQLFKPNVIAAVWKHYSKSFVDKCHQAGAIVIVDEDKPDCWEDALKWGSDGIQTDYPEELIEFLKQISKKNNR